MNDDAGEAEALDRLIEQWAARIKRSSGTTVEAILGQAENVVSALSDLRPYGPKARRMLQVRARLSQPMVSKLEAIGRHAGLMRLRVARLPPSVSSLYTLTRKPWLHFLKAIEVDLRGMSPSGIRQLFASASRPRALCRFLTIAIPHNVGEAAKLQLISDIRTALGQVSEDHGIDLLISQSHKQ